MVNRSNICTADLHDGLGLTTCERTVWPNDQTVLLSMDWVVFGCHREMAGEEMEGVEELGKVERCVEDRVQTKTNANET